MSAGNYPFRYFKTPLELCRSDEFEAFAEEIRDTAKARGYIMALWDASAARGGAPLTGNIRAIGLLLGMRPNWRLTGRATHVVDLMIKYRFVEWVTGTSATLSGRMLHVLCFSEAHESILAFRANVAERQRKSREKKRLLTPLIPSLSQEVRVKSNSNIEPTPSPATTAPAPENIPGLSLNQEPPAKSEPPPVVPSPDMSQTDTPVTRLRDGYEALCKARGIAPSWTRNASLRAADRLRGSNTEASLRQALYAGTMAGASPERILTDPGRWLGGQLHDDYLAACRLVSSTRPKPPPLTRTEDDRMLGLQSVRDLMSRFTW